MMKRFKVFALAIAAVVLLCLPQASLAGFLGNTITSQYYAYGGPYNGGGSPVTFVANGTVQQTFGVGFPEGFDLIVRDNQIEYDLLYDGWWSPSTPSLDTGGLFIANGNLITASAVTITGVSINPSTTLSGFGAGNVTFNANNVAIDWAGFTNIRAGDKVVLDVNVSGPVVPIPPALFLFGSGLIGFWGMRKKFGK